MAGTSKGWLNRRAFTAIDLLIAITVVSAMVVMLVPALSTARTSAINHRCLNNERQFGIAFHQYIADFSFLPGQNPWCYGTGAAVQEVDDPRFPNGPYY